MAINIAINIIIISFALAEVGRSRHCFKPAVAATGRRRRHRCARGEQTAALPWRSLAVCSPCPSGRPAPSWPPLGGHKAAQNVVISLSFQEMNFTAPQPESGCGQAGGLRRGGRAGARVALSLSLSLGQVRAALVAAISRFVHHHQRRQQAKLCLRNNRVAPPPPTSHIFSRRLRPVPLSFRQRWPPGKAV